MIREVEYREIAGFPGYRVGSDGSVWSEWARNGRQSFRIAGQWKLRARTFNQHGYAKVALRDSKGVKRQRQVTHLVLEAFVGPCPDGYVCCHFPDPTPTNCSADNLRWGTRKENEDDKRKHGNLLVGDARWNTKLADANVATIRLLAGSASPQELADKFGVSRSLVSLIISRKRRTAIPA